MNATIVAVTEDNLELVSTAAAKWGMPRSVGWLRRCLFDPTVKEWTSDMVRGHMSVDKTGDVKAIQCYYYQPCYYRQKKIVGGTGAIMGSEAKYGEELLCVLDKNFETQTHVTIGFGNCIANARSAKVSRVVHGMREAPYRAKVVHVGVVDLAAYPITLINRISWCPHFLSVFVFLLFRPMFWLISWVETFRHRNDTYRILEHDGFGDNRFEDFWQRFLAGNDGIISSRDPRRLRWLFDDSIKAGKVVLAVAEKEGRIDGYVLLRELLWKHAFPKTYEVIDICADGNNTECLRALCKGALRIAGRHSGVKVYFSGGMPAQDKWLDSVFTIHHYIKVPRFMYYGDPEVRQALEQNKGWFFGPYDGERCMGYGGYIDL